MFLLLHLFLSAPPVGRGSGQAPDQLIDFFSRSFFSGSRFEIHGGSVALRYVVFARGYVYLMAFALTDGQHYNTDQKRALRCFPRLVHGYVVERCSK
jgi:hypothetical protein